MNKAELVIIGGGPAGMSAAIEAARHGVESLVIDENHRPGGQIYRALPRSFKVHDESELGKDFQDAQTLLRQFESLGARVTLLENTLAWAIFPDKEVALFRGGEVSRLKANQLILAPGAYDLPVPFPGWTLPGVMALGGLQRLVKTDRVIPAKRVLLTGTGPLLWVVGVQLLESDIEIAAILDSASYISGLRYLPRLISLWGVFREGIDYLRRLRAAGVPLLQRHAILSAQGTDGVEEAVYGPVGSQGWPIPGRSHTVAVDTIGVGYGFTPSAQLFRLCGCEHRFDAALGGWIPIRDAQMQTSVSGVFAAGDGAGVAGVLAAKTEGRLAAIGACRALGRLTETDAVSHARPVQAELRRIQIFRKAVDAMFATGPGLYSRIDHDTTVCRCEELSGDTIRQLIEDGALDVNEIKKLSRSGMGLCQGRMCEPALRAMLVQATENSPEECGVLSIRPPVKPISLQTMNS